MQVTQRKVERNGRDLPPGAQAAARFMYVVQREEPRATGTLHLRGGFCSLMPLNSILNLWALSVGEESRKKEDDYPGLGLPGLQRKQAWFFLSITVMHGWGVGGQREWWFVHSFVNRLIDSWFEGA